MRHSPARLPSLPRLTAPRLSGRHTTVAPVSCLRVKSPSRRVPEPLLAPRSAAWTRRVHSTGPQRRREVRGQRGAVAAEDPHSGASMLAAAQWDTKSLPAPLEPLPIQLPLVLAWRPWVWTGTVVSFGLWLPSCRPNWIVCGRRMPSCCATKLFARLRSAPRSVMRWANTARRYWNSCRSCRSARPAILTACTR